MLFGLGAHIDDETGGTFFASPATLRAIKKAHKAGKRPLLPPGVDTGTLKGAKDLPAGLVMVLNDDEGEEGDDER